MAISIAGDIDQDGILVKYRQGATTAPFPYTVQVPGTVAGEDKTLTYPEIAGGTAADTLLSRLSSDTGSSALQNKDLFDSNVRVVGATTQTKILQFDVENLSGASTTTIQLAAISAARTYILPALAGNDTFVTEAFQSTLTNKQLDSGVTFLAGGTFDLSAAGTVSLFTNAGANNITLGGATSTVVVDGDLTVSGTTTTVNTATLDIEDPNITVNNGGNDASSEGSGITVERTSTDGSIVYEDALTSKFKLGALGGEVEVADVSSAQTLTNKTLTQTGNSISGLTHGSSVDNPSSGVHGVVGSVVGTSDAQTLTTKTLVVASNTVTTAASGNLVATELNTALAELQTDIDTRATSSDFTTHTGSSTVHGVSGVVVGTTGVQTLESKVLKTSNTFGDSTDPTKVLAIDLTGSSGGQTTTLAFTNTSTQTWTFQNSSDTVVGLATTDTLTNKTIVAASNTITTAASGNLTSTELDAALAELQTDIDTRQTDVVTTRGDIVYAPVGGAATRLAIGAVGTVLSSDGTDVSWDTPAGTGDVTAAANMTDHTLVRGDGGAKGVQDSGISIDDSDNITGIANLTATGTSSLDGAVTINEAGADVDFRVEGDTLSHLIFVDASADQVLLGGSANDLESGTVGGLSVDVQINNGSNTQGLGIIRDDVGAFGAGLALAKGRAGAAVNDNDVLGHIRWGAHDGTDFASTGASIVGFADAAAASNDTPGRLEISTTASGSDTPSIALTIDSTQRTTLGGASDFLGWGGNPPQLIVDNGSNTQGIAVSRVSANAFGTGFRTGKARGTPASPALVSSGDALGTLNFFGHDGSSYIAAAGISATAELTPAASDMPGKLTFSTVPDASTTLTARMTIDSAGLVNIAGLTASSDVQTDGSKNLISTSDSRLKDDFGTISEATSKLKDIIPRYFKWKSDVSKGVEALQLGFYAQEVNPVIPEAAPVFDVLDEDENVVDTTYGFNGRALIAFLIKGFQELEARVTSLEP